MGQSGAEDRNPGHDPSSEADDVMTVGETVSGETNDTLAPAVQENPGVATAPTYGDADRIPSRILSVREPGPAQYGQKPQAASAETPQIGGRSASGKMWKMPKAGEPSAELVALCDGSIMLAKLLMARGLGDVKEADAFLNTENYIPTSYTELPDVDKAVDRINQAIEGNEHVTVYGDYDVDGVTGTSVLYTVLKRLGASVDFYIPNRATEGYGLNLKAVSILTSKHRTKLIITCDCGVSNFAEINFAKSLGVETLVLDHHTMPELLPPGVAIVHPKRLDDAHPLNHLPGVGVAYKVCEALLTGKGLEAEVPALLDYVTLGMIADLVPLIRENRYLVKIGLPILAKSPRPGIQALLSQVGKMEDTDIVGFGIAPRINAVGRLADARAAVELLTTQSAEEAQTLANQLQSENARRQELCERIFEEADRYISKNVDLASDKALAIFDKGWHHGVVGIVASRLVEKYHKPVFIGELDPAEGIVKGSARSIDGVDLYEVLKANEHMLTKWGGHKMAAGFAMEADRAEAACRAIVETCNRILASKPAVPALEIDLVAQPDQVNLDLARLITRLAPFGMSNKKPVFCLQNVSCSATRTLGKEGKHSRIMVLDENQSQAFECVMWNSRGRVPEELSNIEIAFTPEVNSYNGRERLQLVLADWRSIGRDTKSGAAVESVDSMVPDEQQAAVAADTPRPKTIQEIARPAIVDKNRDADLEKIAIKAKTNSELLNIVPSRDSRIQAISSVKYVWKDLRGDNRSAEIVQRAIQKFGGQVAVFGESCTPVEGIKLLDRLAIESTEHILFWQMPPSSKVFQEILTRNANSNLYLLRAPDTDVSGTVDEPGNFLKRMFGLIRFAVNKRDGQVEGEKLAAAMGASKMSVALALTVLKRVNLIDWFSEEGCIYLDIVGTADKEAEELAEYKQLVGSLNATREFRTWCTASRLDDLQLAVTPNHVGPPPELSNPGIQASDVLDED